MRRLPRRVGSLVGSLVAPFVLVLACGGDDADANTTSGTEAGGGSSSDDGGPALPSFAEPASGRLSLLSTRTEDIDLEVLGIAPGVTELFIDGVPLGPLAEGSAVGRLDTSTLRLFVRGSLVTASHRMVMRTADVTGTNESELVIVEIAADTTVTPVATLDAAPSILGDHVATTGHGSSTVLMVGRPEELLLVPRTDEGWDPTDARALATPGRPPPEPRRTMVASALLRDRSDDDPGRVRVAWRVGEPGSRIDLLDAPWDDLELQTAPSLSLTVDDALGGRPAEWAELHRPWLVGDRLLATLLAPADVEAPRPGDRALVQARIVGDADQLEAPQRVSLGADLVDLDGLGPAIDLVAAERGRPAPFTVRTDQREPRVLDLDLERGVISARPTEVPGSSVSMFDTDLPWVTVTGAFGSRTVASLRPAEDGMAIVAFFDDLGGTVDVVPVKPDRLPSLADVTGPLAPGSIDGLTVVLVPFGDAHPVHAVFAVGDQPDAVPLPELLCDEVALATSSEIDGQTGDQASGLPLACVREGEVWLGSLGTVSTEERR